MKSEKPIPVVCKNKYFFEKVICKLILIYIAPLLLIALLLLINASRLSFDKGVKLNFTACKLVAIIFLQNDLNQTYLN